MKRLSFGRHDETGSSPETVHAWMDRYRRQLRVPALGGLAAGLCAIGLASPPVAVADELTLEQFDRAIDALFVGEPNDRDPLALAAALVSSSPGVGDTVIAVLKLRMLPGWYIYSEVPDSQPFIESEWILDAGSGLEILDDWAGPPSTKHKQLPNTRIYAAGREDIVFFREMEVTDATGGEVNADVGLRYQICNVEYCLAPTTKKRQLAAPVSN